MIIAIYISLDVTSQGIPGLCCFTKFLNKPFDCHNLHLKKKYQEVYQC